jgi:hypothetical protein
MMVSFDINIFVCATLSAPVAKTHMLRLEYRDEGSYSRRRSRDPAV